jgi:hypothetical protein
MVWTIEEVEKGWLTIVTVTSTSGFTLKRSMARGSAALDNPGSQAQSGMLEHGEHDRGAAR